MCARRDITQAKTVLVGDKMAVQRVVIIVNHNNLFSITAIHQSGCRTSECTEHGCAVSYIGKDNLAMLTVCNGTFASGPIPVSLKIFEAYKCCGFFLKNLSLEMAHQQILHLLQKEGFISIMVSRLHQVLQLICLKILSGIQKQTCVTLCVTVKSGDVRRGAYRLYKNEYTSISLLTQLVY